MFRAYTLFRLFGIPVRVHGTLILLLALLALAGGIGGGAAGGWAMVTFLALVFGSVFLHELGHALTARALGIPVAGITLHPIGGLATFAVSPREPLRELLIAGAGPLVNFLVAGGFALLRYGLSGMPRMAAMSVDLAIQINLVLGAFNLLPGYPLDGGVMLRALLARFMPRQRATRITARIGVGTAVVIAAIGLYPPGHFWLVIVALVIFMAAQAELARQRAAHVKDRLRAALEKLIQVHGGGDPRTAGDAGQPRREGETFVWREPPPGSGLRDATGEGDGTVIDILPDGSARPRKPGS